MDQRLNSPNHNLHSSQSKHQNVCFTTHKVSQPPKFSSKSYKWQSSKAGIDKILCGQTVQLNALKNQNSLLTYLKILESEIEYKKRTYEIKAIDELQRQFALILKSVFNSVFLKLTNGQDKFKFYRLNAFFKRHLPIEISTMTNQKEFQTTRKFIQQSNSIHKDLLRISNSMSSSKPYFQSSQCLNCITEFNEDDAIFPTFSQTIVPMENINLNIQDIDFGLVNRISYLMNFSIGCLLIGTKSINGQVIAKGVVLEDREKLIITNKLNDIRNLHIFPQKTPAEKYVIDFIQVTNHRKKTDPLSKVQSRKQYIVRLYFEAEFANRTYFSIKRWKNSSGTQFLDFKLVRSVNSNQQYYQAQVGYKKLHSRYMNANKIRPHPNISCIIQREGQEISYPQIVKPQKEKIIENPDQYGNRPCKTLDHHQSILVLNEKEENSKNIFEQFIDSLKNLGDVKYYKIYEQFVKIKQNLRRSVYYIEHRKKHADVYSLAKNLDKQEKTLILLNIKKILGLSRYQKFQEACQLLGSVFVPYFQTEFNVFKNDESKTGNSQKQYFFEFENEQESIFAFTLLQSRGIRSKFVGKTKIKDAENISFQLTCEKTNSL